MSLFARSADQVTTYAESKRRTARFTSDHPAVRAAKRWCERTGAKWEIGIGGRCELGKRAIKQWVYEWTAPLRKLAHVAAAKWVAVLVIVLVALASALAWNASFTLSGLAVLAGLVSIVLGFVLGYITANASRDGESVTTDPWERRIFVVLWIVGLPTALLGYACLRAARSRFWQEYGEDIMRVISIAFIAVVALAAVILVVMLLISLISTIGGWGLLWWVLGIVGVIVGIVLVGWLFSTLAAMARKSRARKRSLARNAERNDPAAQQRARDRLMPSLTRYYEIYQFSAKANSKAKSELVPFDEWVNRFGTHMREHDIVWSDFLKREPLDLEWSFRQALHTDPAFKVGVDRFFEELYDVHDDYLEEQRLSTKLGRLREVGSFITATLFFAKTKVCPNVILPPWEEVPAKPVA